MENLLCPCCEKPLTVTHQDRYEDLSDHVSNPNGTPSMKDGYQCMNEYCVANQLKATWIEDGTIYMDPPEGIKWTTAHDVIRKCSVSGMDNALGSWSHYYQKGVNAQKVGTKKLHIGKYKFDFVPKMRGHKYPINEQYQPKFMSYTISIWKQDGDIKGAYVGLMPTHRMISYSLNKFNRNYKIWKKSDSSHALKECYNEIMCYFYGTTKDERTYAKISSWLVKVLYPHKCKEILAAFKKSNC